MPIGGEPDQVEAVAATPERDIAWVPGIFILQLLHAASFGALHLGAMGWIRSHMGGPTLHRATGLYIAFAGGLALGIGMPAAGVLFERFGGDAYGAMAVLAGAGAVLAAGLADWRGKGLSNPPAQRRT